MDTQSINEYLEKLLPPTIALLFTAFISVIIGVYLEKFKKRLVFLKYRFFFNALGTTIQNEYWGDIEVRYKGRQTNHLSFVTIEIANDSNIDLDNVNIDVWVDQDSQFLGHNGYYEEGGNTILLEQGYYTYYMEAIQRIHEHILLKEADPNHIIPTQFENANRWVLTNKKFNLPIFNRHTSIKINLLIENFKGEIPQIKVSVLHKSVKLVTQKDKAEENKQLGINVVIWGLLVFGIGTWIIHMQYPEATIPIIFVGVLGFSYLFLGLLFYRLIKFIKYLLA